MSERMSTAFPMPCSGEMYSEVPAMRRESDFGILRLFARPKSATLMLPSGVCRMLDGLMSRWTIRNFHAAASARATPSATWSTSSEEKRCFSRSRVRDVLPLHEFHRVEEPAVPGARAEDLHHVRMIHLGEQLRLLAEALDELGLAVNDVPDDFDRDRAPERMLPRAVEDAHASFADHLVFVDVEVARLVLRDSRERRALPCRRPDGLQVLEQLVGVLIAVGRGLGQAAEDDALQLAGDGGAELPRRRRIDVEELVVERGRRVVAVERKLARGELVEHHAEGIEVRPDVAGISRDLLGRDVAALPSRRRRPGSIPQVRGEPDVRDADRAGGGKKHVRWA